MVRYLPWITIMQSGYGASAPPKSPVGTWEASDGSGGAVGLNLWVVSRALSGYEDRPVLQIGVYQRSGLKVRCGEENFFDTSWSGKDDSALARYANGRLAAHYHSGIAGEADIDVRLSFNTHAGVWEGRFHRGGFDRHVVLQRATDRSNHDQEVCTSLSVVSHAPR